MSTRRSKPMTAEELMAQLARDPDYQAREQAAEAERQQRAAAWREAEQELVAELRSAGLPVESVWDLVQTDEPYPAAVPILLRHLERAYPDRVREGIARALAVPEARVGWDRLVTAFEASSDSSTLGVKWALACALGVAGDETVVGDVIRLVRESRHGENRVPLLEVLARTQDPRARAVLESLRADPDLGADVRKLLPR